MHYNNNIIDFKIAAVCPVFKKGNAKVINNYRPISLLSNISKTLQKIMYMQKVNIPFWTKTISFSINNSVSERTIAQIMFYPS